MSMYDAYSGDYGLTEAAAIRRKQQRSIANTQSAMLGQQRGSRKLADISRKYVEGFGPKMAQYGRRGLAGPNVQSGIQRKGLEQYARGLQESLGAETTNIQDELNRISMEEANNQADLEAYIADLKLRKNQSIVDAATALRQLQGY
jgi:hypothetical protein